MLHIRLLLLLVLSFSVERVVFADSFEHWDKPFVCSTPT